MSRFFHVGDRLTVHPSSQAPRSLVQSRQIVTALDEGSTGGWDVYDVRLDNGDESSVYGFQIEAVRAKRAAKRNPTKNPKKRELSVFEQHGLAIAKRTVRMPAAMRGVMGGMSYEEAVEVLRRHGLSVPDAIFTRAEMERARAISAAAQSRVTESDMDAINRALARKAAKRNSGYSPRNPKIDLLYRAASGESLPSVDGGYSSGVHGKRDWNYYSSTNWYRTVKEAVAAMRAKMPQFEWRGQIDKARRNPMGGTFTVTHANPRKAAASRYVYELVYGSRDHPQGYVSTHKTRAEAEAALNRSVHNWYKGEHFIRRVKKVARANPAYRASFTATGDPSAVRRSLKSVGYTDVRLRGATKGSKRKPGPYALFVKSHMKGLMARGMSAPEAMKEIGRMWKSKGARQNPSATRSALKWTKTGRARHVSYDASTRTGDRYVIMHNIMLVGWDVVAYYDTGWAPKRERIAQGVASVVDAKKVALADYRSHKK